MRAFLTCLMLSAFAFPAYAGEGTITETDDAIIVEYSGDSVSKPDDKQVAPAAARPAPAPAAPAPAPAPAASGSAAGQQDAQPADARPERAARARDAARRQRTRHSAGDGTAVGE